MHSNFAAHLHHRMTHHGESRRFVFLNGKPGDPAAEVVISYRELDCRARRIAEWMIRSRLTGKPVLLLYPSGLEFLQTFLGCLYAGAIAVPAPIPSDARSLDRLTRLMNDAGIDLVLTTSEVKSSIAERQRSVFSARSASFIETDGVPLGNALDWQIPALDLDSAALLQYTSGSTSEPKGVVVSHGNLLYNEARIQTAANSGPDSIATGWLPHFHDMGLIGLLLHPLYVGADCVFMAPTTFMKRPIRWLEAITHYRATMTAAPDFAYDLCARTVTDAQLSTLDLSSMTCMLNGAEPLRYSTLQRFQQRFAAVGFRRGMYVPCYGMAESTLHASACFAGREPVIFHADPIALERHRAVQSEECAPTQHLLSSGRFSEGDLVVVDPDSRTILAERRVGEVWLCGRSVAQGYWGRPDLTTAVFGAFTVAGEGPYLRTGDLGFVADGEMFVTGRLKDLVIINGRNLYPQDVECAIRDLHPALQSCASVVFCTAGERETVVLVQEIKEASIRDCSRAELLTRIKQTLLHAFGIAAPSIVFVKRGEIQRTTSGKVKRDAMRRRFVTGEVATLGEWSDCVCPADSPEHLEVG